MTQFKTNTHQGVKMQLRYDGVEDRFYGFYLKFKEQSDGHYCIINLEEELLGSLEKTRCGKWMHWCLLLDDGCYLSPGCMDEVREMMRLLGGTGLSQKKKDALVEPNAPKEEKHERTN